MTPAQQQHLRGPDRGALVGSELAGTEHGQAAQLAVQVEVHVTPSSTVRSADRDA
ncbi:hypothetical protein [Cellulomonas sp. P5_E12]